MSAQLAAPSHPDQTTRAPRRRTHTALAVAVAGVAAAIAAGGLAAGQILLPDQPGPAQESQYVPSAQGLRELSATVAAEYRTGLAPASRHVGTLSPRASRQLRESIVNQYRSR